MKIPIAIFFLAVLVSNVACMGQPLEDATAPTATQQQDERRRHVHAQCHSLANHGIRTGRTVDAGSNRPPRTNPNTDT